MKKITDPDFKYTPAKDMGPDYLKKKFKRMQRKPKEPTPPANVEPLKRRTK